MKKHSISISLTALMVLILFCGLLSASEYKSSELNRKKTEISSLQLSLSEKISLAQQKRGLLMEKIEELKEEIRQEIEQLQIETYHQAIQSPRIEFNLKLIQLLFGYISGLNEKIRYLQDGYQTLDYYLQQTQDDLLMIKTLNDLEVDKLIAQINSVLDEYIPEISKPIFDTNNIPVRKIEKIWKEIVRPKKNKG